MIDAKAAGEKPLSPVRQWVRLARHCESTGDTPDAVHSRRRKRQWVDGIHCVVGPDGNLWVCPHEVNRWIQGLPPSDADQPQRSDSLAA